MLRGEFMSNIEFKINIESDSDGFISFECPFCKSVFSLNASELNLEQEELFELFCPYCGLNNELCNFYTKEVITQIENIATNYVCEEINKVFGKIAKKLDSKYVTMSYKPLKNKKVDNIKEVERNDAIFECEKCCKHLKAEQSVGNSKIYCSYCGVDLC